MNHAQWKTRRTKKLLGETVTMTPEYIDAGYAFALARALYARRTTLGLSQAETAERAGMAQSQISSIEGGGSVPTLRLLNRLAKALDSHLVIDLDEESPSFDFRPRGEAPVETVSREQLIDNTDAQVIDVDPKDAEEIETHMRRAL